MTVTGAMRAALPAVLIAISAAADTQRVFRVYSLGFADGPSAEAAVRAAVSEGGRVVLDEPNRRLLVFATGAEHERIAALAAELARPPTMVRVEVRRRAIGRAVDAAGALGVVGTVGPGGTRLQLSPRVTAHSMEENSRNVQTLLVASGRSARLEVGERVPWLAWLEARALDWGLVSARIEWAQVGAFLAVEPTVVGEGDRRRIHVRLVPELNGIADGRPARIRFERVATELIAAPGETIRFGGSGVDREFYERFLIGVRGGSETGNVEYELTPTIVEPGR